MNNPYCGILDVANNAMREYRQRIIILETRMQKLRNMIYKLQCGEHITIDEWEEQCTWFNDDGTPK